MGLKFVSRHANTEKIFFLDCLILYKGSAEKVSTLVWEAVDDFSVVNNQKHNSQSTENEDNFINLIGLRPGENAIPVSNFILNIF